MARLNESAAPVDAAEILRRKYSRQNKEIARVNSTQCIRIRSLENEISRLLAENLDLREQVLRLQSEAEANSSDHAIDYIGSVKADLEAKLLELGILVASMEDAPVLIRKRCIKKKNHNMSPTNSPDRKGWKNICTLTAAVGGLDGRLPPILENKTYHGHTWGSASTETIFSDTVADATNSPDIGPPPVSQFVNQDPVKIDLSSKPTESEDAQSIDPANSINLEQRRKRKEIPESSSNKRPSRFEPRPSVKAIEAVQSFKAGAKRKLSIRDDDDGPLNIKSGELSSEEFNYTKRTSENKSPTQTSVDTDKTASKVRREIAIARGSARDKSGTNVSAVSRKALGPKSTNTDIVNSPKKTSKVGLPEEMPAPFNDSIQKELARNRPKEKNKQSSTSMSVSIEPLFTALDTQSMPETPGPADFLSPLSSGYSTMRVESRDTPPPTELSLGTEGQRPSRRARGSVSYVEPNLRDKMRRPTKDLVDAVTGEDRTRRTSSIKIENEPPSSTSVIKQELVDDDSWKIKSLPSQTSIYGTSPLIDKHSFQHEISEAPVAQQHQQGLPLHQETISKQHKSDSVLGVAALLAERKKAKGEMKEDVKQTLEPLSNEMAKLDIYEFSESARMENGLTTTTSKEKKFRSRSRQVSSATDDSITDRTECIEADNAPKSSTSMSSRRRLSTTGSGPNAPQIDGTRQKLGDTTMKKSTSNAALINVTKGNARSDRVGVRRRSMML